MGALVSRSSSHSSSRRRAAASTTTTKKTRELRDVKPKWRSDIPLTCGQLRSKRDEFWETAPAFEGRQEIWDALRAAATALEENDLPLAQAIIQGANVSLPNGTLLDSYDELGTRYVLPVYVLSAPTNLVSSSELSPVISSSQPDSSGAATSVRLRISTGREVKLSCKTTSTVGELKRKVSEKESISSSQQKWFYSGHLLTDQQSIGDLGIPRGWIIQVIVSDKVLKPHKTRKTRKPADSPDVALERRDS